MNYLEPVNGSIGKHSFASHVLHKGQPVVQQFHDCGFLIQHVSPVGDHISGTLLSSRSVIFGAALVRVEGTAVGFAVFDDPSTPMLTCGTYPMPVGASYDSTLNSVIVGMDPEWDHQCGWNHVYLMLFKSAVGQVVSAVLMLATFGLATEAIVAEQLLFDTSKGLAEGFTQEVVGQALGDAFNTPDVGRRYQERMQRSRQAPGADFDSAHRREMTRGMAEGGSEALVGPVYAPIIGGISDKVADL
jgi:hypothetical protein